MGGGATADAGEADAAADDERGDADGAGAAAATRPETAELKSWRGQIASKLDLRTGAEARRRASSG